MSELTHLDAEGHAHMVDVGEKDVTQREAVARGVGCAATSLAANVTPTTASANAHAPHRFTDAKRDEKS